VGYTSWGLHMPTFTIATAIPVVFLGLVIGQTRTGGDTEGSRRAYEFLATRRNWTALPPQFLRILSNRLKSPDKAREFADLCEKGRIFKERVLPLSEEHRKDPEAAVFMLSSVLTSHAGGQMNRKQYSQAKTTLDLALLLNPTFWPAWGRLAIVSLVQNDCPSAIYWADKVLSSKEARFSRREEKEVAETLEDPNIVGTTEKTIAGMNWVKSTCKAANGQ